MALRANGYRLGTFPHRCSGGPFSLYHGLTQREADVSGRRFNQTAGEGIASELASVPAGARHPVAWTMARQPGAMSCKVGCYGAGALAISMAGGVGISGQTSGAADTEATLSAIAWGDGSAAGDSSASGYLYGIGKIAGSADGTAEATGGIFAAVSIQGVAAGLSEVSGTGYLAVSAIGVAAGSSTVSGSLAALVAITGTASGSSSASGTITGAYFATGQASGVGSATGTVPVGYGWIRGEAIGTGSASLTPYAMGFMNGSTSTASGDTWPTAAQIAAAVWSYSI